MVDEQAELGGSLLSDPGCVIEGMSAWEWLAQSLEQLRAAENVTLMPRTTAIGYYHDNFLGLSERLTDHMEEGQANGPREQLHRVWAEKVILATGAIERPLVFAGNDRPGVMLASAAQTFINRFGVAVGENIVAVTSHDSGYKAAFDLADADIGIVAIIDCRPDIDQKLRAEAEKRGIEIRSGWTVTATKGSHRVRSITVNKLNGDKVEHAGETLDCDAVIMSGGWTPSVHLWSHSKGTLEWREDIAAYVPDKANENAACAGACNGDFGLAAALKAGSQAGGGEGKYDIVEPLSWTGGGAQDILPTHRDESRVKAFVDFQNDVTAKDIRLAVREGFKSIEHIKRYTTTGMATDQGKTSNLNGLQIAARALNRPVTQVGLTTFRPPYTPTTFGALAGNNGGASFDVVRKTPIDPWAEAHGAVFEPVALWRRARYFPRDGEDMDKAVARECKATRDSLGIFDASTLGKIEVVGPDAAEFMNRMYTNPWTKLGVGRCRYG